MSTNKFKKKKKKKEKKIPSKHRNSRKKRKRKRKKKPSKTKHKSNVNNNNQFNPIKFGSARRRTKQQKKLVQQNYLTLWTGFADNDIICFTDGATSKNPGPSGSGCVIVFGKSTTNFIEGTKALGFQTNNKSELYAIGMSIIGIVSHPVSKSFINTLTLNDNKKNKLYIRVCSDSKYAIGALSYNWCIVKNPQLIAWIKNALSNLCNNGFIITFHWVGGHAGIKYNERADHLASKGLITSKKTKTKVDVTKPPAVCDIDWTVSKSSNQLQSCRKYSTHNSDSTLTSKRKCEFDTEQQPNKRRRLVQNDNNIEEDIWGGIDDFEFVNNKCNYAIDIDGIYELVQSLQIEREWMLSMIEKRNDFEGFNRWKKELKNVHTRKVNGLCLKYKSDLDSVKSLGDVNSRLNKEREILLSLIVGYNPNQRSQIIWKSDYECSLVMLDECNSAEIERIEMIKRMQLQSHNVTVNNKNEKEDSEEEEDDDLSDIIQCMG